MLAIHKAVATAVARAALASVIAVPSHDDRGSPTLILRWGAWVREIRPCELATALEELRELRRAGAVD